MKFRPALAITWLNLKNIRNRLGSSLVIVIGIAGVVSVLISVLALGSGFRQTNALSGRADRAIVLRAGASAESSSSLTRDIAASIENAPGVRKAASGASLISPESLTIVDLPLKATGLRANVALRGLGPSARAVRPEIRIVSGRMFAPGLREIAVGSGAEAQFRGLTVGSHIDIRNQDWTVVGVFASGGDAHESELIADLDTVLTAYQRSAPQSVTVVLESPDAQERFGRYIATLPGQNAEAHAEPVFFASQSSGEIRVVTAVALVVGLIMALGAIFAALNTMYSAVSARAVEIATLRTIGFGSGSIIASVLAETFLLASLGAALGIFGAWLFFDGVTVTALNPGSFTQLVFKLSVSPLLIFDGVAWTAFIALIGGLLPAIRAVRVTIAEGLRTS